MAETPEFNADMTDQQVVDALLASQNEGSDESTPPAAPEQAEAPTPESDQGSEEQPQAEDSFTGLNPADLPPDVRPYYDSMLADYRRKTQEVASERGQYEALEQYGGAETAVQAMEWLSSLQNPENALQLQKELTEALVEQGYDLGTAKQEATRQVTQAQEQEDEGFEFEAARDPRFDNLQKEVEELRQFRQEEQERNLQLALSAQYDRDESELIRDNPSWTDDDLEHVYNLSFSTGGNLKEAAGVYNAIQSHILGRYIEAKQPVPGAGPLPPSGPATQAQKFTNLNDNELDRQVREFVNRAVDAEQ